MDSARITDTGLARVLESNPGDYKAMCAWLRARDGLVSNLQNFARAAKPGMKHLKIVGLNWVTKKHIMELKSFLFSGQQENLRSRKQLFYHNPEVVIINQYHNQSFRNG
ncbi:hypothetical protein QQ045_024407 [Rhodiola kirilowii]